MPRNKRNNVEINNDFRNEQYKLDFNTESFLDTFNDCISNIKLDVDSISEYSPIFIYGLPRSGSSLLYEMICSSSNISFINNFISKFWQNPSVGIKLNSIFGFENFNASYNSDIGKFTDSVSSPYEFMYFWDSIFNLNGDLDTSFSSDSFNDPNIVFNKINSILNSFNNSTLFKSQYWITYQVPLLRSIFPNAKFILIKRDPFFTAQSIYFARKKLNVSINHWWSIRPPGYQDYLSSSPISQIAFQVNSVNDFIYNSALTSQDLVLEYNDLCMDPLSSLKNISSFLSYDKVDFDLDLCPSPFVPSTKINLNKQDTFSLKEALNFDY